MRVNLTAVVIVTVTMIMAGCVTQIPPPSPPNNPPKPAEQRITHTLESSVARACGTLEEFVLDVHKLDGKQKKALLDQLSSYDGKDFSCDRLKTGILLSQIGKTISEDNLALEILESYKSSDRLSVHDRRIVRILSHQSEERKRLHVLLYKLGERLNAEENQSEALSGDILALQEKLNQLQKLEADINETEQSISTPTTSALSSEPEQNTGS